MLSKKSMQTATVKNKLWMYSLFSPDAEWHIDLAVCLGKIYSEVILYFLLLAISFCGFGWYFVSWHIC